MTKLRWARTVHLGKSIYTSGRFEIRERRLAGGGRDWLLNIDGRPARERAHDLLADAKEIAEEYAEEFAMPCCTDPSHHE